jgi:hypothetical protein
VALLLARYAAGVAPGLNAEYFPSMSADERPAITAVDDQLSTAQIEQRWPDLAPQVFRVRWFGYLNVPSDNRYTFSVTADDSAVLSIDGQTVIETGVGRDTSTGIGRVTLTSGAHAIAIDYRQLGGNYAFEWAWARDDGTLEAVPAWRTAARRSDLARLRLVHIASSAARALAVALGILCVLGFRQPLLEAARRRRAIALLLFFVGMAVVQTWPLASDPAHLSRNDNADTILNEWTLAWVAHQAVTSPGHLFDANIFYPERYTLAYSESMIVQSAMAAPLLWLGASPVLAYNIVLIAGFALNGWVLAVILHRWTGDTFAAVLSGMLFAFNANILTRLPHMQALHVEFLPLALFAWDRVLRTRRVRDAVALGLMVALQSLTSVYLMIFSLCAMCAAGLARAGDWLAGRLAQRVRLLLAATAVAAAVAIPFLLPYAWVHQLQGFERSPEDAASQSATLASYFASPSRLHYGLWSYRFFDDSPSALFPGVTASLLATASFLRWTAIRDPRARMALLVTIAGVLLSLGPTIPGYATLFEWVPIFRVVRVVARFGYLALMGLAVLAGFGAVEVRRLTRPRAWPVPAAVLLVGATLEPLAAPLELSPYSGVSRIYDRLRATEHAVVIELPFQTIAAGFEQAQYMLNSTRHWKPMLNGYSGFRPQSFYDTAEAVQTFPAPQSIAWLQHRGVTHVFVHLDAFSGDIPARLANVSALHEVASDRAIRLYELDDGR